MDKDWNKEMELFDINYNSNIGKLFRKINDRFADSFGEYNDYGFIETPISDYLTLYYFGDYTPNKVFDAIVKILHLYDMICYNEDTKEYKTYLDKSIVIALNKLKKAINEIK